MAHFAELDENNIVLRVIVVNNEVLKDDYGVEQEDIGIRFCRHTYGLNTSWKQTSYNRKFRKHFAARGMKYDESRDAFIDLPDTKPAPSWVWKEEKLGWDTPTPQPPTGNGAEDGHLNFYTWDESKRDWVLHEVPYEE